MSILEFIVNMFKSCLDMMDSVEIFGVSVLDFSISLIVIGAILSVLVAHISRRE